MSSGCHLGSRTLAAHAAPSDVGPRCCLAPFCCRIEHLGFTSVLMPALAQRPLLGPPGKLPGSIARIPSGRAIQARLSESRAPASFLAAMEVALPLTCPWKDLRNLPREPLAKPASRSRGGRSTRGQRTRFSGRLIDSEPKRHADSLSPRENSHYPGRPTAERGLEDHGRERGSGSRLDIQCILRCPQRKPCLTTHEEPHGSTAARIGC